MDRRADSNAVDGDEVRAGNAMPASVDGASPLYPRTVIIAEHNSKHVHMCEAVVSAATQDGVPPTALIEFGRMDHYKSRIVFVGVASENRPRYVLKSEPEANRASRWSPKRECDGLRSVQELVRSQPGLGAIEALAWTEDPRCLVTRYQCGQSVRSLFDRAILSSRSDELDAACSASRQIAHWHDVVRRVRHSEATAADEARLLGECLDRIEEVYCTRANRRVLRAVGDVVEDVITRLTATMPELLHATCASHGDLAPQNFLLDDSGALHALDLEGFAVRPLDIDLVEFRTRLERYALRGRGPARRAAIVWSAFLEATTIGSVHPDFALFCYLHRMLAQLAWVTAVAQRNGRRIGESWHTRVQTAFWIRSRLRWLRLLVERSDDRHHLFSHVL